jgi:protein-disulfide isomerase
MNRIVLPVLAALVGLAAIAWFTLAPQGDGAALEARIAQAVHAQGQADAAAAVADRNNRIAARWPALAQAPASPVLGNPQGDVTIVVFSDYACPYCRVAEPRLMALAQSDGRIRIVMKEFPILTPQSLTATRMALAAARQGRYEAFHTGLMQLPGQLNVADMEALARSLKLDMALLARDMESPDVSNEIIANFNLARGIRTFQTPTFLVNGKVLTQDSDQIDFASEVAAARAAR